MQANWSRSQELGPARQVRLRDERDPVAWQPVGNRGAEELDGFVRQAPAHGRNVAWTVFEKALGVALRNDEHVGSAATDGGIWRLELERAGQRVPGAGARARIDALYSVHGARDRVE